MPLSQVQRVASLLVIALALFSARLYAADSALSDLVKKFTERRTAQPPLVAPAAPRDPAAKDPAPKAPAARKPSPPLSSLPVPKAGGARRILLVDDDWTGNTDRSALPSGSDRIFRDLVAAAVGGDAAAWSVEMVETYKHGPAFERLRDFNVIVWYTGESYGGGADSVSTLSTEDEKTVRRYLQEVGGAFVLVSPGFLSTRAYGTTWTDSDNAFLKEVMGVNGFATIVQRFAAGTVRAFDGTTFGVEAKGVVETQFSAVNPDGAAVAFTTTLDPQKTAAEPVPVAVAHPFGGGRFVYVGFSFENITDAGRTKAFSLLLDAATGPRPAVAASPPRVTPTILRGEEANQRIVVAPPPVWPPPPAPAPVPTPAANSTTAPATTSTTASNVWYNMSSAKLTIVTGNDNKESSDEAYIVLYQNGGASTDFGNTDPLKALFGKASVGQGMEYKINSSTEIVLEDGNPTTLTKVQQYGLKLKIWYHPKFFTNAWKINSVVLTVEFKDQQGTPHPTWGTRTIPFSNGALLTDTKGLLELDTDGFLMPKN